MTIRDRNSAGKLDKGHAEWPTLAVVAACYLGFAASTLFAQTITLWLAIPFLAIVLTLHSSLQHEVLHGHPFSRQWVCDLLVFPAVGLFIPYQRFRDLHLAHHLTPNLTDPYDDPESNYSDPKVWASLPRSWRMLLRFNNTLAGRMLIGPLIGLGIFYRQDFGLLRNGHQRVRQAYLMHFAGLLPVAMWIMVFSTMPLWAYVLAAYGAMSLLKVRTFLEHRAHEQLPGRSVIIERGGLLAFLFLNNSYHAVHHAYPKIAWYNLPALYMARKQEFLTRNDGYSFATYREVFRNFLFCPKDPVPHPLMPAMMPVLKEDAADGDDVGRVDYAAPAQAASVKATHAG